MHQEHLEEDTHQLRRSSQRSWLTASRRSSLLIEHQSFRLVEEDSAIWQPIPPPVSQASETRENLNTEIVSAQFAPRIAEHIPGPLVLSHGGLSEFLSKMSIDSMPGEFQGLFRNIRSSKVESQPEVVLHPISETPAMVEDCDGEEKVNPAVLPSFKARAPPKLTSLLRSLNNDEVYDLCSKNYSYLVHQRMIATSMPHNAAQFQEGEKRKRFSPKMKAVLSVACLTKCLCRLLELKPIEPQESEHMTHWELRLLQNLVVSLQYSDTNSASKPNPRENPGSQDIKIPLPSQGGSGTYSKPQLPPDFEMHSNFTRNIALLRATLVQTPKSTREYKAFLASRHPTLSPPDPSPNPKPHLSPPSQTTAPPNPNLLNPNNQNLLNSNQNNTQNNQNRSKPIKNSTKTDSKKKRVCRVSAHQKREILSLYRRQRYGKIARCLLSGLERLCMGWTVHCETTGRTVFAWSDAHLRKALTYL